jgi:DHA1 family bicyclomycin/chloramphenicol resistance-like MFS transporter
MSQPAAPPAPSAALRTVILTCLLAFTALSVDIVLPILPLIARDFRVDAATAQLSVSVFVIGYAVCQLIYGPMSDRFGRRPMILIGMAIYFAASIGCLFAGTIVELAIGRLAQAFGACAGPVLARAIVRDVYEPSAAARMLAFMGMVMALVPATAPILGGFAAEAFGWRSVFVVLAAFSGAVLLCVFLLIGETNRQPDPAATRPRQIVRNYLHILGNAEFARYAAANSGTYAAMFTFHVLGPFVMLERYGVSASGFALWFISICLGYMLGNFISGRIVRRLGTERTLQLGLATILACAALLAALAWSRVETVLALIGPMSAMMVGVGLVFPNSMALALAPFGRMAGSASAMIGFIASAAGAMFGTAVARFHDGTPTALATGVLTAASLGALVYFLLRRRAAAAALGE